MRWKGCGERAGPSRPPPPLRSPARSIYAPRDSVPASSPSQSRHSVTCSPHLLSLELPGRPWGWEGPGAAPSWGPVSCRWAGGHAPGGRSSLCWEPVACPSGSQASARICEMDAGAGEGPLSGGDVCGPALPGLLPGSGRAQAWRAGSHRAPEQRPRPAPSLQCRQQTRQGGPPPASVS